MCGGSGSSPVISLSLSLSLVVCRLPTTVGASTDYPSFHFKTELRIAVNSQVTPKHWWCYSRLALEGWSRTCRQKLPGRSATSAWRPSGSAWSTPALPAGEGGVPAKNRPFLGNYVTWQLPYLGIGSAQAGRSENLMLGPIQKSQYPSRRLAPKDGLASQKSLILA